MISRVEICGVDTSSLPRLTDKEMQELIVKIKGGDTKAREYFITCNMRLVLSLIKRFWNRKNLDDIFQAGCVGLIKSIDNFDETLGVKFSTYAVPMIIGEIKRLLRDGNSLRVARSIRDSAYRVLQAREELEREKEDAPTTREIADKLNIKEYEVMYALDAIADPVSIYDTVLNKSGDTLMLCDQLEGESNVESKWAEEISLKTALEELCDREKKIILLRYFEGRTQTEISKEVGISQAQVSRLEKNALKNLKCKIK